MTKKELEAKVINAQSAVAKREAVLAKHREQLAKLISKGADQYDIRYKEDDIKTATGKLEDARRILKNWQDKLGAQISRDAFIEANAPQVIKDFLERWKASAIIYYRQRRIDFIEYRKELRQKEREARLEALHTLPELERYRQIYKGREPSDSDLANLWPRQAVEEFLKERGLDYRSIREKLAARTDQITNRLLEIRDETEREQWLENVLEDEKKAKLAEMDEATDFYVETVLEEFAAAGEGAELMIEQRLDLSQWIPEGFGTSDAVIIGGSMIQVIDLKYGKGIKVEAKNNPQFRLYGLGAVSLFGDLTTSTP